MWDIFECDSDPLPRVFFRRVVVVSQSHCQLRHVCLSVCMEKFLYGDAWYLCIFSMDLIQVALPAFRIWKMALRFLENLCTPLLSHTNINARCPTDKLNIHVAISTYNLYEFPAWGWEFIFPFWRPRLMCANGRYATLVMVADNQYVNTDSYQMIWKEPDISNRSCCVVTVLSIILRHFRRVTHKNRRALRTLPGAWSGETRVFWQLIMRRESSPKTNIFVVGIAFLKVMWGMFAPR